MGGAEETAPKGCSRGKDVEKRKEEREARGVGRTRKREVQARKGQREREGGKSGMVESQWIELTRTKAWLLASV